jgi:hypothetical protein
MRRRRDANCQYPFAADGIQGHCSAAASVPLGRGDVPAVVRGEYRATNNVVVIIVKLHIEPCIFDSLRRKFIRLVKILWADRVVPHSRRPGPVVGQRLIDNVPRVAAVSPVLDEVEDVVLHDRAERGCRPVAVEDPFR